MSAANHIHKLNNLYSIYEIFKESFLDGTDTDSNLFTILVAILNLITGSWSQYRSQQKQLCCQITPILRRENTAINYSDRSLFHI